MAEQENRGQRKAHRNKRKRESGKEVTVGCPVIHTPSSSWEYFTFFLAVSTVPALYQTVMRGCNEQGM